MKKGQIRLTETIAVMFIFFVLIVFGMIFYFQYQKVSIKETQQEQLASRAMDTTLRTLFLPELLCSIGQAEAEDNCLDVNKLNNVNKTFADHTGDYYFNVFSYSKISVQEIYPGNTSWVVYDKMKPNWTQREPTFFVVSLRDNLRKDSLSSYGFGYLTVEVYS